MTETGKWKIFYYEGALHAVLTRKHWYISYITKSIFDISPNPETAIIIELKDGSKRSYILRGDFRKKYNELLPGGLKACLQFYLQNEQEHGSKYTRWVPENKFSKYKGL
jgi:exonuclease V gamma subunit